jgi:hypothetical protein
MGQLSLFSRAETAAMRDRTKARNYDPERDEFRRQQRFRRGWGLQRRHAEKLRRLRESGAVSRPPSARASGQVRPVTCASRPTHRGPAPRQAAPAKAATRPSAARLPAPRPLEVPVSPRATLPSGGSRPALPVLPASDRPVLAGLRKAGPSPHAADSSAPSSAGIWPPSSGSFTLVIIAESCKITGVGRRPSEGRELHSKVSATGPERCVHCRRHQRGEDTRAINAELRMRRTGREPPPLELCRTAILVQGPARLGGAGGFALCTDTDPQLALYAGTGRHPRAAHGHGPTPSPPHGHRVGAPRTRPTPSPRHGPTRSQVGASPRTRADRHGPAPPHGHEPTDTDRRLPTDTSLRPRSPHGQGPAPPQKRAGTLHRHGPARSPRHGPTRTRADVPHGHGPARSPSTETPVGALTFGDRWRPPRPTDQAGSIDLADQTGSIDLGTDPAGNSLCVWAQG